MESDNGLTTCNECLEILELMLDNEASKEQESYVNEHIESCIHCFEHMQVEKEIRELIKTKIAQLPVPDGLASEIRSKIQMNY